MSNRRRLLAVLWIAGAVSVACNVLSAEPTTVGRPVAAWPPVALLLVVEVLARSPLPHGPSRWATITGAGSVAVVAAVASFHHMHSVALSVGESTLVAWLFPLSVDGLAVVTSVALVNTNHAQVAVVPEDRAPIARSGPDPGVSLFVPPLGTRSPVSANGAGSTTHQPTTSTR